jgi:hypothetical protein
LEAAEREHARGNASRNRASVKVGAWTTSKVDVNATIQEVQNRLY